MSVTLPFVDCCSTAPTAESDASVDKISVEKGSLLR